MSVRPNSRALAEKRAIGARNVPAKYATQEERDAARRESWRASAQRRRATAGRVEAACPGCGEVRSVGEDTARKIASGERSGFCPPCGKRAKAEGRSAPAPVIVGCSTSGYATHCTSCGARVTTNFYGAKRIRAGGPGVVCEMCRAVDRALDGAELEPYRRWWLEDVAGLSHDEASEVLAGRRPLPELLRRMILDIGLEEAT